MNKLNFLAKILTIRLRREHGIYAEFDTSDNGIKLFTKDKSVRYSINRDLDEDNYLDEIAGELR